MSKTPEQQPTGREGFNRILGLGCYAAGVIMFGLLAFGIFERLRSGHSLMDGAQTFAIFAAAVFIFFGLGYTSGRNKS